MFKSFIAWLKSLFSFEPIVVGKIKSGCGNCGSCKCPDSAPNTEVTDIPTVAVAPPKKSVKKPRTPKI